MELQREDLTFSEALFCHDILSYVTYVIMQLFFDENCAKYDLLIKTPSVGHKPIAVLQIASLCLKLRALYIPLIGNNNKIHLSLL